MSASAVLRRARGTGASLWLNDGQLGVSGPVHAVREVLTASEDCEPEIAAALRLADQAFSANMVPPSGIAFAWDIERLLRAELAALIAEVTMLLGECVPATVVMQAVREPTYTLAANVNFFREVAVNIRSPLAAAAVRQ